MREALRTIHACEELSDYPSLHLPLRALAFGRDGVYLVDEEQTRGDSFRLLEGIPQGLFGLARRSRDDRWGGDVDERYAEFLADRK